MLTTLCFISSLIAGSALLPPAVSFSFSILERIAFAILIGSKLGSRFTSTFADASLIDFNNPSDRALICSSSDPAAPPAEGVAIPSSPNLNSFLFFSSL